MKKKREGRGAWYISNRLGFGIIKWDLGLGVLGPRVSDGLLGVLVVLYES